MRVARPEGAGTLLHGFIYVAPNPAPPNSFRMTRLPDVDVAPRADTH